MNEEDIDPLNFLHNKFLFNKRLAYFWISSSVSLFLCRISFFLSRYWYVCFKSALCYCFLFVTLRLEKLQVDVTVKIFVAKKCGLNPNPYPKMRVSTRRVLYQNCWTRTLLNIGILVCGFNFFTMNPKRPTPTADKSCA